MTFEHTTFGDVHVLTPKKDLVGREETLSILGVIDQVAGTGPPKIVLDLGKISWVNSTGLGSMVRMRTTCSNHNGWFRLARVGDRISQIFLVTKLVLVFDTFESVEEAVSGIHKNSA
ncbi:MAG: STAS domain-containing protein [Chitinivibrionia bacterium]|nr:STAS domain-containing protein [Chitinivibrionia bacterium]